MSTIQEMISVMKAYEEGKTILIKDKHEPDYKYGTILKPNWNWADFDFRVKEEYEVGKKYRCFYRAVNGLLLCLICTYDEKGFKLCEGEHNPSYLYTDGYFNKSAFTKIEEIKEQKFRPYKNCEELLNDLKSRNIDFHNVWLKFKTKDSITMINAYSGASIALYGTCLYSMEECFKNYTFEDGTPFGIKE